MRHYTVAMSNDTPDETTNEALRKLSDAELVQRIADLQATVQAHLYEVTRRLTKKVNKDD